MKEIIINIKDSEIDILKIKYNSHEICIEKKFTFLLDDIKSFKDFILENNLQGNRARVVLNISGIITKEIEIPLLNAEDLERFIGNNIESYFIVDKNEYCFDYRINSINKSEKKMNVLIVTVPKGVILNTKKMLRDSGIKIKCISLYLDAIFNLFKGHQKSSIAYFDVGKNKGSVVIVKKNSLFLYAMFDYPYSENNHYREVINNMNYYLNFYSAKHYGETVNEIYVNGELFEDKSFINVIKQEVGENINTKGVLRDLEYTDHTSENSSKNIWVLGLYIKDKTIYKKKIDFSKSREEHILKKKKNELIIRILILTCITLSYILFINYYKSKMFVNKTIVVMNDQVEDFKQAEKELEDLYKEKKLLEKKMDILNETESYQFDFMKILEQMQKGLPSFCRIQSLYINKEFVEVTFQLLDPGSLNAARLVIALNRMDIFEPVDIEELELDDTVDTLNFVLKMK